MLHNQNKQILNVQFACPQSHSVRRKLTCFLTIHSCFLALKCLASAIAENVRGFHMHCTPWFTTIQKRQQKQNNCRAAEVIQIVNYNTIGANQITDKLLEYCRWCCELVQYIGTTDGWVYDARHLYNTIQRDSLDVQSSKRETHDDSRNIFVILLGSCVLLNQ